MAVLLARKGLDTYNQLPICRTVEARVTGQPSICGLDWGIAARAAGFNVASDVWKIDVDVDVTVERKRSSVE